MFVVVVMVVIMVVVMVVDAHLFDANFFAGRPVGVLVDDATIGREGQQDGEKGTFGVAHDVGIRLALARATSEALSAGKAGIRTDFDAVARASR
jgi:hypothetical protein